MGCTCTKDKEEPLEFGKPRRASGADGRHQQRGALSMEATPNDPDTFINEQRKERRKKIREQRRQRRENLQHNRDLGGGMEEDQQADLNHQEKQAEEEASPPKIPILQAKTIAVAPKADEPIFALKGGHSPKQQEQSQQQEPSPSPGKKKASFSKAKNEAAAPPLSLGSLASGAAAPAAGSSGKARPSKRKKQMFFLPES